MDGEWIDCFCGDLCCLSLSVCRVVGVTRRAETHNGWSRLGSSQALKYLYNATDFMCPFSVFHRLFLFVDDQRQQTRLSLTEHRTDGVFIYFIFSSFWKMRFLENELIPLNICYICEIRHTRMCPHAWRGSNERQSPNQQSWSSMCSAYGHIQGRYNIFMRSMRDSIGTTSTRIRAHSPIDDETHTLIPSSEN